MPLGIQAVRAGVKKNERLGAFYGRAQSVQTEIMAHTKICCGGVWAKGNRGVQEPGSYPDTTLPVIRVKGKQERGATIHQFVHNESSMCAPLCVRHFPSASLTRH